MAVPTTGTLTMLGLAQEALYGTYGSGTITSPIHLYDLVNGGNSAGSGNSYPTVNTGCTPNPTDPDSLPLNPVTLAPDGNWRTFYYNASIGNASNLTIGDAIYENSDLTTPESTPGPQPNYIYQVAGLDSNDHCSSANSDYMLMYTDTNGVITSVNCYYNP
jgi:hypothetical protein